MDAASENWLPELEWLLRRIGLDPGAVSAAHVEHALHQRVAGLGLQDTRRYVALLQADEEEFEEFVELLIVPESWFFRDVQPFRCLRHFVANDWRPRAGARPLRVLCVPCCAGEEPYSVAMTLLATGMPAGVFSVDGVDISRRMLRRAAQGTYAETAFREHDAEWLLLRERYCRRAGNEYAVADEVRTAVRFLHGNLVAANFLAGEQPYDVIFCRNLFIYLDDDARCVALTNLRRLLGPDGLLYVGHVEAAAVARGRFGPYRSGFPFAFRSTGSAGLQQAPLPVISTALEENRGWHALSAAKGVIERPEVSSTPFQGVPPVRGPAVVMAAPVTALSLFTAARRAADQGLLDGAARLCLQSLQTEPPSAQVYCLLGVVRQAQGNTDGAQECFQKALYLDPHHHEALVHAALLARQRGDERLAANLRRRAARSNPDS